MNTAGYVITLVHGTFASKAKKRRWTSPESPTVSSLVDALNPGDVTMTEPFVWSGSNKHSARNHAGSELAKRLIAESKEFAGKRRILVGHSHGGNVIMYAMKELARKGKEGLVHGVVCLATPHITVRQRGLRGSLIAIGVLVGFVLASVYAMAIAVPAYNEGREMGIFGVLFMAGFIAILVLPPCLFGGPLHRFLDRKAAAKATELSTPALENTPVLSVKVEDDEAFFLLKTQKLLSGMANPVWRHGTRLVAWIWFGVIVTGAAVAFAITLFNLIPFVPDLDFGDQFDWFGEIFGKVLALALFGLMVVLAVAYVLPLLFRSHPGGFGWESIITRSCLAVAVAEVPERCRKVEQKTFFLSEIKDKSRKQCILKLRHSYVYTSPKILEYVGHWIRDNTGDARSDDGSHQ